MALTASPLHAIRRPDNVVEGNVVELRPRGPFSPASALSLQARIDALVEAGHRQIVLDLREAESVDRGLLASVRRTAEVLDAAGGRLELLAG